MKVKQILFISIHVFFMFSCSPAETKNEKTQVKEVETKDSIKAEGNYPIVEHLELSWPADDILCDAYDGSDGYYSLHIYRLKETKKIINISEHGAYCQGDSDFSNYILYDENGKAVYSYSPGLYVPSKLTLYKNGYPETEILSSGEGNPLEKSIVQKPEGKLLVTSEEYQNNPQDFLEKVKHRLNSLQNLDTTDFSKAAIEERNKLMDELTGVLNKKNEFIESGVFRKATYKVKGKSGEITEINGVDIPLRMYSEEKSEITGYVSASDNEIEVIDVEEAASIKWCKIKFKNKDKKMVEGWIQEKVLMKGTYN